MPSVITIPSGQLNVPGQEVSGNYGAIVYASTVTNLLELLNEYKISPHKIKKIEYDTKEKQYFAVYHI